MIIVCIPCIITCSWLTAATFSPSSPPNIFHMKTYKRREEEEDAMKIEEKGKLKGNEIKAPRNNKNKNNIVIT